MSGVCLQLTVIAFFSYASCSLFRDESLVSIVALGHANIIGCDDLSREWDEMRERFEDLERKICDARMELAEL